MSGEFDANAYLAELARTSGQGQPQQPPPGPPAQPQMSPELAAMLGGGGAPAAPPQPQAQAPAPAAQPVPDPRLQNMLQSSGAQPIATPPVEAAPKRRRRTKAEIAAESGGEDGDSDAIARGLVIAACIEKGLQHPDVIKLYLGLL